MKNELLENNTKYKVVKELLVISFNLLKESMLLDDNYSKKITENFNEDTYITGFNFLVKPINNLINNLDKYFDKFEDFNVFPNTGKNLDYIIFERNVFFPESQSQIMKEACITFENGKEYKINNIEEAIYYLLEEVIPTLIDNLFIEYKKIDLYKDKEDSFIIDTIIEEISTEIMKELLLFHKETNDLLKEFSDSFKYITNNDIDFSNSKVIVNIEKNIEDKLFELNKNIWEDIFYEIIFTKEYLKNEIEYFYPETTIEFKNNKNTYKIKDIKDFCKWFLFIYK